MRLFLLRRLLGLCCIAEGFIYLFTPFKRAPNLWAARKIARENYRRHNSLPAAITPNTTRRSRHG